jgi:DNA repair photolyase
VAELVGIARLAAQSPTLEAKRHVEYFGIETRKYLTKCDNMPFRWTINPYRGCEFGCKYCYARYAHEFMELRDPMDFERKIFVKQFDPIAFRKELEGLPRGETIAIGTATDPYQPVERRYQHTRSILEVFANTAGLRVGITTKSDLVARDVDILREVARRHYISIHMTVTTMDRELARLLEPMAPRPDLRLHAVRKLTRAGLRTRVSCSPVMPLINDSELSMDAVAQAAARAGAQRFWWNVLFLKPCSKQVFLPFVKEQFPAFEKRYRERYGRAAYLRGAYPEMIRERAERIRKRYGLDREDPREQPELWSQPAQLSLFQAT